jgi:hypothetical protein
MRHQIHRRAESKEMRFAKNPDEVAIKSLVILMAGRGKLTMIGLAIRGMEDPIAYLRLPLFRQPLPLLIRAEQPGNSENPFTFYVVAFIAVHLEHLHPA